jgi:amino-acid N-acetyltransferase
VKSKKQATPSPLQFPVQFRKAAVRDGPSIHSLILAATRRGKILKRTLPDIQKSPFYVAVQDGKILACCALEIYNRKLSEIRSLAVDPRYEGKGLASRLVQHCLQEAKRKKVYEVLVITDRDSLFRRFGFSEQLHGQRALFYRP